jgi:hypothetical protein
MSGTWSNCPIDPFLLFQDGDSRLDGTRTACPMLLTAAPLSSTIIPPVRGRRRRCPHVVLNVPYPSRRVTVASCFRIGLGVPIASAEQDFRYEWRAERIHNPCLARRRLRFGTWCNQLATPPLPGIAARRRTIFSGGFRSMRT